jgi:hypothetical protein
LARSSPISEEFLCATVKTFYWGAGMLAKIIAYSTFTTSNPDFCRSNFREEYQTLLPQI